jgi:hypothetical protein
VVTRKSNNAQKQKEGPREGNKEEWICDRSENLFHRFPQHTTNRHDLMIVIFTRCCVGQIRLEHKYIGVEI